jgi:hypothetical protein
MAESTALTRYGLRREAGTDWDRLWLTVTHTTHSDRWLCLYLVAASIANRQPLAINNNAAEHGCGHGHGRGHGVLFFGGVRARADARGGKSG